MVPDLALPLAPRQGREDLADKSRETVRVFGDQLRVDHLE